MSIIFPDRERNKPSIPDYRVQLPNFFYFPNYNGHYTRLSSKLFTVVIFRAPVSFDWDEVQEDTIQSHLKWEEDEVPESPFISVFQTLKGAEELTIRRDRRSTDPNNKRDQKKHNRAIVAKINTAGLQPLILQPAKSKLRIPIWVRDASANVDKARVTFDSFEASRQEDIWISVSEVRHALKMPTGLAQNEQWLACGSIRRYTVDSVLPYDGVKVHQNPKSTAVLHGGYRFNWATYKWVNSQGQPQPEDQADTSTVVTTAGEERAKSAQDAWTNDLLESILVELQKLNLQISALRGETNPEPATYPDED